MMLVRAQDKKVTTYTPFTRSSKHRANIKQAWWNPAPWLKCRPRLSPQLIACYTLYRPFNYNPPALQISMLITIVLRANWMNASKRRANVEQLARVFWIHLLDVCSMFFRSCKRGIRLLASQYLKSVQNRRPNLYHWALQSRTNNNVRRWVPTWHAIVRPVADRLRRWRWIRSPCKPQACRGYGYPWIWIKLCPTI